MIKKNLKNKSINNLCIFVWNTCNLSCDYCYLEPIVNSRWIYTKKVKISKDILFKWLSILFNFDKLNKKKITFTWWESLLYIEVIQDTLDYILVNKLNIKKDLSFNINTNWLYLNSQIILLFENIIKHNIDLKLNISLDWDLDSSSNRFINFNKVESTNMYIKINNNIKNFKKHFDNKISIRLSTTFTSNTYKNILKNSLFFLKWDIFNYIDWFSLRPALWDFWRNLKKINTLQTIFFTLKRISVTYPKFYEIIKIYEDKKGIECILKEIVLAPDGNFYKCEFLIWDNNITIWDVNSWIKNKFLTCEFDEESYICKYEKCIWCLTYCQTTMKITWENISNKIYLDNALQIVGKFYKSLK